MSDSVTKVFVTGGSGFLGRHFLSAAAASGISCFVLTRNPEKSADLKNIPGVRLLKGGLDDMEKFRSELMECSVFINIAGEKKDETKMVETNALWLARALPLINSVPGMRFLQISSTGVYGIWKHPDNMLTEESPCFPESVYEKSKLKAEEIIREYGSRHPLKYVILRPSNVFGENDPGNKMLNLFRALRTGRFFYLDRWALVNYVYVRQVTDTMMQFIVNDCFDNGIYNINSYMHYQAFVELINSKLGIKKNCARIPGFIIYPIVLIFDLLPEKLRLINKEIYHALSNRKFYDNKKLNGVFPLTEKNDLAHGIENLVRYYRSKKLL